jgi:hypothetical protein
VAQRQLESLIKQVSNKSESEIKDLLKSPKPEMRFAAAVVVGDKGLHLADPLVEMLNDSDILVRQAARRSLVVLSYYVDAGKKAKLRNVKPQAVDYGPKTTTKWVVKDSQKKWQDWVDKNRTALGKIQVTQNAMTATETKTK